MKILSATEQKEANLVPVFELDRRVESGDLDPVCINDGRIIGSEDE